MKAWLDLLHKVMLHGAQREDRTGVGTKSLFGVTLKVGNYESAFPAVTAKKLIFQQVAAELACFLKGHSTLSEFHREGCVIWDGNGTSEEWLKRQRWPEDLGRIYGVQWRDWRGTVIDIESESVQRMVRVDQLKVLVEGLKADPYSRRHLVTAWNPAELDIMCLPPCHVMFQCYVRKMGPKQFLDICVIMRSVDLFLGLPFDIASYALLQRLLAKETGLSSGELTFMMGDAHIYLNHLSQVEQVLSNGTLKPPTLKLAPEASLFNFSSFQAELENYQFHAVVKAPLNV